MSAPARGVRPGGPLTPWMDGGEGIRSSARPVGPRAGTAPKSGAVGGRPPPLISTRPRFLIRLFLRERFNDADRLGHGGGLLRRALRRGVVGHPEEPEHGGRLLPRRAAPRVAHRRGVHLRLQHRVGAPRGARGLRRHQGGRAGPLRAARVVSARPRVGPRTLLCPVDGLHHAGVSRAPLLPGRPVGPLRDLPRRLRPHQDRGRNLRRRHRVPDPPPGDRDRDRHLRPRQLLDRLLSRHHPHGHLHGPRRPPGGRLHGGGPDRGPHCGLAAGDGLRPLRARRVGGAAKGRRLGDVRPVEAARARREDRHVGAGQGRRPHRVVL